MHNKNITKYMKNFSVKVAGMFAVVAFAVTAATPVAAQSIAELQAMIATLQSQIAALSGGSSTTTPAFTYTRDLTLGSTGADVTALQTFLESKGFLTMPAGVSKGYFGQLTRTALAQYQTSKGISPAVGYFGPITRAAVQAEVSTTTPGTTPTTPSTGLQGGAGDIVVSPTSVDTESEVAEGELEKVLAFRIEAEDSDVQITNLRVTVENKDNASNRRPDRYLESIEVWMGNTKVGTINPADMSRNGNVYSRNVALNNAVVREGLANRATFYVAFKALNNIDSLDMQSASFDVTADNIRFVDGSGAMFTANDTVTVTGIEFTDPASAGDVRLRFSLGSNNPSERTIQVNEFSTTNNVDLLEFRVKAEGRDMLIEEIHVDLVATGSADLDEILADVKLMQGNRVIADINGSDLTGASDTAEFDLYDDLLIEEGETVTLKVVARLLKQDGNFADGDTLRASWDAVIAEDRQGNSMTSTIGSANGFTQTLFVNGAEIEFVSSTSSSTDQNSQSRDFTLVFDVTAIGEDLVVARDVFGPTGIEYDVFGPNGATVSDSPTFSSNASFSGGNYTVFEGQTRRFTLTVNVTTDTSGQYRIVLDAVKGIAPATVVESVSATVNQ
jgi:peptidoglycan hydrolase-like protein with peptidoglycan-binding domain